MKSHELIVSDAQEKLCTSEDNSRDLKN